jgi:hypothetical protein
MDREIRKEHLGLGQLVGIGVGVGTGIYTFATGNEQALQWTLLTYVSASLVAPLAINIGSRILDNDWNDVVERCENTYDLLKRRKGN